MFDDPTYESWAHVIPCVQDGAGTGMRLASGMSMEGLIAEPTGNLFTISRNTSGLDTMQSIENALPAVVSAVDASSL